VTDRADQEDFEDMDDIEDEIDNAAHADAGDDDDTGGAPTSSDDKDTDIKEDDEGEPPCVVLDNKLAQFILRCDWQSAQSHLQTEAGKQEANAAVFGNATGEWVPLHLRYLPCWHSLPNALKVRFPPSHALLKPNPDGRLVILHAMKAGASPDIIRTMVEAQPSMPMMRLIHHDCNERGNLLIHDMLLELGVALQEELVMAYLKIVADKETECLLERDDWGRSVLHHALTRAAR
jgi:hypothetical protein